MPGSHKHVALSSSKMIASPPSSSPLPSPTGIESKGLDTKLQITVDIFKNLTKALARRMTELETQMKQDEERLDEYVFPCLSHCFKSNYLSLRIFAPYPGTYSAADVFHRARSLYDSISLPHNAKTPTKNGPNPKLMHEGTSKSMAQVKMTTDILFEALRRNRRESESIVKEAQELLK